VRPTLLMPKSGKGGGRNRSQKKHERYSVPITVQLAAALKEAASGRVADAPLLLQADGNAWGNNPGQTYHRDVDKVVTAIGLDPAEVTVYCLRHSSIVRMLLKNIPIRLVASLHNTSVSMIEKHYSKYIVEYGDEHARAALLQLEPTIGDNIVALAS
jgi:integrase